MRLLLTIVLVALALPGTAGARSPEVAADFQRQHPCPSTGLGYGRCPNFTRDHARPLCGGGPDNVQNLRWEQADEARTKDREEWRLCDLMRAGEIPRDIDTPALCRRLNPQDWPLLMAAICR